MAAVKMGALTRPTASHGAHKTRAAENRTAATNAASDERPRMMPAFCGLRVRYSDTNFRAVVPSPRLAKVEKAATVVWTRRLLDGGSERKSSEAVQSQVPADGDRRSGQAVVFL